MDCLYKCVPCLVTLFLTVTAQGHVGETRKRVRNFGTSPSCTRSGIRGEAMVDDVRVADEGAVDYGSRGRSDPPKLWFPCSFFVFLFVVSGQWGQRSTRARWTLSESKTQRRPHSARERVRGGFLCCFVVFVSFFEQGKKRHREGTVMVKRGEMVKRGGGLRGLRRDCGGAFWRPCGTRLWRMRPGAS